jgi:sec-independent protein translocase protein TatB
MTLGWEEIVMLLVFALLIFGPSRLPEIARQIGRFMGEIKRLSREFEDQVRDVTEPFHDEFRNAADPFRSAAEPFHRELTAALDPEEADIRKAEADAGMSDTGELDEHHSTFLPKHDT